MIKIVTLVATGDKWVGYGTRSFASVVAGMINKAENEIILTIYILSDNNVICAIEKALKNGVKIEIYIYKDDNQFRRGAIERLSKLGKIYPHLSLFVVTEDVLHAKVLVTDRKVSLVGSANFTLGGFVKNYELGVMIEDKDISLRIYNMLRRIVS